MKAPWENKKLLLILTLKIRRGFLEEVTFEWKMRMKAEI